MDTAGWMGIRAVRAQAKLPSSSRSRVGGGSLSGTERNDAGIHGSSMEGLPLGLRVVLRIEQLPVGLLWVTYHGTCHFCPGWGDLANKCLDTSAGWWVFQANCSIFASSNANAPNGGWHDRCSP